MTMPFEEAMEIAESMDLPDGAFWAMAHELAGLEYGDGFDLIAPTCPTRTPRKPNSRKSLKRAARQRPKPDGKQHRCGTCGKDFASKSAKRNHRRDLHKPTALAQSA